MNIFSLATPTGRAPVLAVTKNGSTRMLTQSISIARHFANEFNLTGSNCYESQMCDEVIDCINDLINLHIVILLEPDRERRKKLETCLANDEIPRLLGFLNRKLATNGGDFIVGSRRTWADFGVAAYIRWFKVNNSGLCEIETEYPELGALARLLDQLENIH